MRNGRGWGAVALVAAAFYGAFTFAALAWHGWNPLWFVWIGERYATGDPAGRTGYDGQFVYYIARDGWAALPHVDAPVYRFGRILYPLSVRLLSAGDAACIPWAMVAINAAAIVATTALLTRWLTARGVPRWYGLVHPLFVGTMMAYSRDLTEPLAYGLAAAGLIAWLGARHVAAVMLFVLAGLTREVTLLFPAAIAIAELLAGRVASAITAASAVVPESCWLLYLVVGRGLPGAWAGPSHVTLGASFLGNVSLEVGRVSSLLFVGLPLLALMPAALRRVYRVPRDPVSWVLALNVALGVALPGGVHNHIFAASRTLTGVLLALIFLFPEATSRARALVAAVAVVPTLIWLGPVLSWAPWTAKV
jgi:hypothetical protein